MTEDEATPGKPIAKKKVLLLLAGAAGLSGLILSAAILPAEFGIDPLGLGRLTGIGDVYRPEGGDVAT
ncbi:MAG: hypothetical protein CFE32_20425, partial [Alphaproteobacteria bacterium PA3]